MTTVRMTTIRLSVEMEQKLQSLSAAKQKTKSELIREALESYFKQEETEKDSYELGKDFFGKYGSGKVNLSRDYKKLIKEKLHAKHNTR